MAATAAFDLGYHTLFDDAGQFEAGDLFDLKVGEALSGVLRVLSNPGTSLIKTRRLAWRAMAAWAAAKSALQL